MAHIIIARVVEIEVWIFLGGLAALVGYRLLTGQINVEYLLYDKDKRFSPGRVQLLVFTLAGAFSYLTAVSRAGMLLDVPRDLLAILGGSSTVYLGGKVTPALMNLFRSNP